ncbi:hypothetical protein K469DRAFT_219116 [Zopfia rhizophila CBS 207.26]|uniref:Uncharacterized protein n=1 Tax=Zopfia rhizophila CBS 207.26 TaxID=1314779 RepID=A0A6A6DXN5_9PEZI|nr:hypothetical protein K469DRAFT_219116 [Zopfia rhizophila CBS 207.26]
MKPSQNVGINDEVCIQANKEYILMLPKQADPMQRTPCKCRSPIPMQLNACPKHTKTGITKVLFRSLFLLHFLLFFLELLPPLFSFLRLLFDLLQCFDPFFLGGIPFVTAKYLADVLVVRLN